MNLIDPQSLPSNPANPSYFSGAATLRPMPTAGIEPVTLTRVEFAPEARTNWHTHGGVQILFIVAGRCRFQHAGGPVEEAGAGETIFIAAVFAWWSRHAIAITAISF